MTSGVSADAKDLSCLHAQIAHRDQQIKDKTREHNEKSVLLNQITAENSRMVAALAAGQAVLAEGQDRLLQHVEDLNEAAGKQLREDTEIHAQQKTLNKIVNIVCAVIIVGLGITGIVMMVHIMLDKGFKR